MCANGAYAVCEGQDSPVIDNSETVYISSLALLKMLRHGRAGELLFAPPPRIPQIC